ncbi:hypothetical protein BVRB_1g023050 [Beta vulgaris subsp. vulgaris]|uniref:Uncharacterized protein n=1 Tax=Beta vulgaris subsp. vulgaris TaxID=3555 RepID=A0A0J8BDY2_BETVV|nr:hypothetical protein BVRB_1g023050 [Beta vulgaris subsp. vulgaris]
MCFSWRVFLLRVVVVLWVVVTRAAARECRAATARRRC